MTLITQLQIGFVVLCACLASVTGVVPAKAIISGDEIQYAVHGEEFEITCSVETTDSSIILTWDFMDGSFDAGNQAPIENGRRTNTLQFTVDASIHGGMITCDESKSGIDRSMDSIILIVSPKGIVMPTELIVANQGDNISLQCDYTQPTAFTINVDAQYIWVHNITICADVDCSSGYTFDLTEDETNSTMKSFSQTFELANIDLQTHAGEYICGVVNDAGIGFDYSYIYFAPKIISHPEDALAEAGGNAEFYCEAEAYPDPEYQWQRRNEDLEFNSVANSIDTQYMVFPVSYSSAGYYRCIASIATNGADHQEESNTAVLYVSPNGSVLITAEPMEKVIEQVLLMEQGSNFSLTCFARGGPNNSHSWNLNNQLIEDSLGFGISSFSEDTESRSFVNVTEVDATTHKGIYFCSVTNEAVTSGTPPQVSIAVIVSPKGIVSTSPKTFKAKQGDSVTLSCSTDAHESNTTRYMWLHNIADAVCTNTDCSDGIYNFNLTDEEAMNIYVGNSQQLTVSAINATDGGEYVCVVVNAAGIGIASSDIYVKPDITEQPMDVEVYYFDLVMLSCNAKGFPEPTIQWQKQGTNSLFEDLMGETNTTLVYENALLSNSGVYRCVATNIIDMEEYSAKSAFVVVKVSVPIRRLRAATLMPTSVVLAWDPPQDPNLVTLIEQYNVEVLGIEFVQSSGGSSRKRKQVGAGLAACYQHLNISGVHRETVVDATVTVPLVPFSNYEARVSASTSIGFGNVSTIYFSTPEDERGEIINLRATTRNSSSILVSWNAPPCPNGLITGYHIYYRLSNYTQSSPINSSGYEWIVKETTDQSLSMIIDGLMTAETYSIHVRAFFDENEIGRADQEVLVTISTRAVLVEEVLQVVISRVSVGSKDLSIGLPSVSALGSEGITNIQFYGVVVVPVSDEKSTLGVEDFEIKYPNVQPYDNRGNNQYYIAAGWNNESLIPDDFSAGDKTRTAAIRNGVEETYYNAELSTYKSYCFYVMISYQLVVGGEEVIRYMELSCQKTDRAYSLTGLVVSLLLLLLLILLCVLCVLILIYCCYRRRRKESSFAAENTNVMIKNPVFHYERATAVPLGGFSAHVKYMHSNNNAMFSEEFAEVEPFHDTTSAVSNANQVRNRYESIPAYDHSRVVLNDTPFYINASHIEGFKKPSQFIATQGPMVNTVNEFWEMIWDNNVDTIVMLTELEEKDNKKCFRYWPDFYSGFNDYGSLKVKLDKIINGSVFITRHIKISKKGSKDTRNVQHFQLLNWNQNKLPQSSEDFLDFVQEVEKSRNQTSLLAPLVVHGSAGVGRTGVYIAFTVQLDRANKDKTIDVYNYVQYMRRQRPNMVSNEAQYIFLHDALLEAINKGIIDNVQYDQSPSATIENP